MKTNLAKLSIIEIQSLIQKKEMTVAEVTIFFLNRLAKFKELNAVVTNLKDDALACAKKLDESIDKTSNLFGIPFLMKDNIATINQKTTGSSKILDQFVPVYDSTVNTLLKDGGAINIAKTALDELGMGGDGLYAHTGYVYNPWNQEHITGGSSSGSAALVAVGASPFSLGTDTGDSIRKPAAFCGIVGYKPTYGLISRNGVFPYAPSLDTVGIFANKVEDIAQVLDTVVSEDFDDLTSLIAQEKEYLKNLKPAVKDLKIAVLNYEQYKWKPAVKTLFEQAINYLKEAGAIVESFEFPVDLLNSLLPVYMIISFAEATSCHASLDGVNFGARVQGSGYQDTVIKTRTQGFGNVVKRRYVIGAYALSESHQEDIFLKAKRVRRIIVEQMEKLFAEYDAYLMMPTINPAPTIKDILERNKVITSEHDYMEDLLLLANFNGCPSITIPLGLEEKLPIGLNINTAPFQDQKALNIATFLSQKIDFKNPLLEDNHE